MTKVALKAQMQTRVWRAWQQQGACIARIARRGAQGGQGMEGRASSKGQIRQRCQREGGGGPGMGRLRLGRA